MIKVIFTICGVISFFQQLSAESPLPRLQHEKCSLKDSECLKKQVQESVVAFSKGFPDLGIEDLSKMFLDCVVIHKDGLIYDIRNVTVRGLENAVIDKFWIDTHVKYIHITFRTTFSLECDYSAEGYLFSYPVHGAGKAHIVKKNVIMELILLFDIEKNKSQKDFINLKTYRYGFDQEDGTDYRFENLFDGDKEKSDIVHGLVNNNWRTTATGFGKHLFDKMNDKIFNAIKTYLRSFSLEDIALLK